MPVEGRSPERRPLSDAELDRRDREAREMLRKACEMGRELIWGQQLNSLLQDRGATEEYLTDADPLLRCGAIDLLQSYWGPDQRFLDVCEKMALEDRDQAVRQSALGSLIAYYEGTNNPRVGKILGGIVCQKSMDPEFREWAYEGLFMLQGLDIMTFPTVRKLRGGFRFPEDVDWSFVNSFLGGDEA